MTREHLDHLQQVLQNGRRVGVHVIATAPGRVGVPTTLASAFGARVILRMTTADDYLMLGVPSKRPRHRHPSRRRAGRPPADPGGDHRRGRHPGPGRPDPRARRPGRRAGARAAAPRRCRRCRPGWSPRRCPRPTGPRSPSVWTPTRSPPIVPDLLAGPLLIAGRSRSGRTVGPGRDRVPRRAQREPAVRRAQPRPRRAPAELLHTWLDGKAEHSGSWALRAGRRRRGLGHSGHG